MVRYSAGCSTRYAFAATRWAARYCAWRSSSSATGFIPSGEVDVTNEFTSTGGERSHFSHASPPSLCGLPGRHAALARRQVLRPRLPADAAPVFRRVLFHVVNSMRRGSACQALSFHVGDLLANTSHISEQTPRIGRRYPVRSRAGARGTHWRLTWSIRRGQSVGHRQGHQHLQSGSNSTDGQRFYGTRSQRWALPGFSWYAGVSLLI